MLQHDVLSGGQGEEMQLVELQVAQLRRPQRVLLDTKVRRGETGRPIVGDCSPV
jgi:hypothetical protein